MEFSETMMNLLNEHFETASTLASIVFVMTVIIVLKLCDKILRKKAGKFTYYTYRDKFGTKYLVSRSRNMDKWKSPDFSHYVVKNNVDEEDTKEVNENDFSNLYDPQYELEDIGLYVGLKELQNKMDAFQDVNDIPDLTKKRIELEEKINEKMQRRIRRLKMIYPIIYLDENMDIDYNKIKTVVIEDEFYFISVFKIIVITLLLSATAGLGVYLLNYYTEILMTIVSL